MRVVEAGPAALDEAARSLAAGGVVVLPTDTVYGVAVRAARAGAAAVLAAAKGRSPDQPVAVLVGSLEQASAVAVLGPRGRAVAGDLWPGPLTLVMPRRDGEDWALGGDGTTVGVRWPDDRFVTDLARQVGPLAVSSANRHGRPPAFAAPEAVADLVGPVDLVVDGGRCDGRPSTVVTLTDDGYEVLREGGVPTERVEQILGRR